MNPDLGPVLIIVAAVTFAGWLASTATPPTLQFGVRVPPDRTGEPVIAALRRTYRLGLVLGALVAAAITVASSVTLPVGGFVAVGVVTGLVSVTGMYLAVHRRLAQTKATESWYSGQRIGAATVLTTSRSWRWAWWLAPATAIIGPTVLIGAGYYSSMPARLPVHFALDGTANRYVDKSIAAVFWPVAVQVLLTIFLGLILWGIQGSRYEFDPAAPEASFERQRRFRSAMTGGVGLLILGLDGAFLLTSLATWGVISQVRWIVPVGVLVLSVLPAVAVVVVSVRMGTQGWRLVPQQAVATSGSPRLVQRDDDRFWKGGLLYWNREDPAFFVSKRFGAGWTLNFAHPVAWLVLAVPVVIAGLSILAARGG